MKPDTRLFLRDINRYLEKVTGRLSGSHRQPSGRFIKQYLNVQSDKRFYADLLNRLLQDAKQSSAIVEDLYKGFEISPDIPMVKNVLSVLKKAGVLDNRHVKAGFQAMGWTL